MISMIGEDKDGDQSGKPSTSKKDYGGVKSRNSNTQITKIQTHNKMKSDGFSEEPRRVRARPNCTNISRRMERHERKEVR